MGADGDPVPIGDVIEALSSEFPDITISKIRFLETQGLVAPERTPSGYRRFRPTDVDRLRLVLRMQKQQFLPLRVIKERLAVIDAGGTPPPVPPASSGPARFAAARDEARAAEARRTAGAVGDDEGADDLTSAATGASMTRPELARAAGLDDAQLAALESFGLIVPVSADGPVVFDEDALAAARLAASFLAHGVEPRHLRMYRTFADREAALFEQVLLPYRRQRNPEAQAKGEAALGELAALGRRMRTALLRQALRRDTQRP